MSFYRRFHSIRYVGRQLAIRLIQAPSPEQVTNLHAQFADLLSEGTFELRGPLPEELDEPDLIGYVRRLESMADAGLDLDELDEEDEDEEDDDDRVGGEAAETDDDTEQAGTLDAAGGDRLIEEVERFLRDQG